MIFNNKIKSKFLIIIATMAVIFSVVNINPIGVYAEEEDDAAKSKSKFNSSFNTYTEGTEGTEGFLEKFSEEDFNSIQSGDRNNIKYVLTRVLAPGLYINDVRSGVMPSKSEISKGDLLYDGVHACDPNEPLNLINHSCNIPNFTTELVQNITSIFNSSPINSGGKTTAKSAFGFGVPSGVDDVPTDPAKRQQAYTALELYGYNLKFTSYSGEWDRITTSTESRMLTNFGRMDKVKMIGTSLWNTVTTTVGGMIKGFSFNPFTWAKNIFKSFGAGASAGLNTILDTEELNVIATRGWRRDSLNETLYNVYVLTDKEVAVERSLHVIRSYSKMLEDGANASPELQEVMALATPPPFTYKKDWESEESIKARDKVTEHNKEEDIKLSKSQAELDAYNTLLASDRYKLMSPQEQSMIVKPKLYVVKKKDLPAKVYYTESEQLGFWDKDNLGIVDKARVKGVLSVGNASRFSTYEDLKKEWITNWGPFQEREFNVNSKALKAILEDVDSNVFEDDFHSDPKRAISHYACANNDGSVMRDSSGNIEYLYSKENKDGEEFINPKCGPVRSPIQGALFGSGWHVSRDKDTRHIDYVSSKSEIGSIPIVSTIVHGLTSFLSFLNSSIAKLTNVILDFSFSPLLKNLGIDTIIVKLMEGFRDTIFFPMSVMVAAVGAFLLFLQLLKNASALQLIGSVGGTILIFVIGATFLLTPEAPLKVIDEWPSKMDSFLVNIVLADDNSSDYCSTGSKQDGIRTAQCNVWGAMVFNPWVEAQFGTSYNNLYANGYAPQNGDSFNNTNQSLVGNAEVNMGGGVKINNWAMYQLSKTKAGTITSSDKKVSLGSVDKDMYRLVDLQAGPNNGAKTDSRYFNTWMSGGSKDIGIMFMATIQSIAMLVAIGGLGVMKIENSFVFALTVLLLPIMLLFALTPAGKNKFKSYMSGLASLLLKRATITLMIGVLLRVIISVQAAGDSFYVSSFLGLAISSSFIMYKKELISMIVGGEDNRQILDMVSRTIPLSVKQKAAMTKAKVKGVAVGVYGGISGTRNFKKDAKKSLSRVDRGLRRLDKKGELSDYDTHEKARLEAELKRITKETGIVKKRRTIKGGVNAIRSIPKNTENIVKGIKSKDITVQKTLGAVAKGTGRGIRDKVIPDLMFTATNIKLAMNNAGGMISRREETAIRKKGFSANTIAKGVKRAVISDNADAITHNRDTIAKETYQDISSRLPGGVGQKAFAGELGYKDAQALNNPKIQKLVFDEARKRKDAIEAKRKYDNRGNSKLGKLNPLGKKEVEPVIRSSALNKEEADAATEYLKKQRRNDSVRRALKKPLQELNNQIEERKKEEKTKNVTSQSSTRETKRQFDDKRRVIANVVNDMLSDLSESERDSIIEQLMRHKEDKE